MTRDDFRATVEDRRLLAMLDYWDGVRGTGAVPTWGDLKPEGMGSILAHAWAWTLASGALSVRVAGGCCFGGASIGVKGSRPEDLFSDVDAAMLRRQLLDVALAPSCLRLSGDVLSDGVAIGTGERLMLPYAGADGIGVVGATVMDRKTMQQATTRALPCMIVGREDRWGLSADNHAFTGA